MNNHPLKYFITIVALIIVFAHLKWPALNIDAITVILLFIALIPWLSPLFKSIEFPGGWKVEYQEYKEKVDSMVAKAAEPAFEGTGPMFSVKAISVNDESTRSVIKALGNSKYTWRYMGGLKNETNLSEQQISKSISWLLENKLINELNIKEKKRWALSQDGRDLLNNIQ